MTIKNKFNLGQKVWHVLSEEHVGIVSAIIIRGYGFLYGVTWSNDLCEGKHDEYELSATKPDKEFS